MHRSWTILLIGLVFGAALTGAGCGGGGGGSSATMSGGSSPTPTQHTDVVTYKNDVARTGQNLTESVLTTTNVNPASFGLLRILAVDGNVDAQPLYLSALSIGGSIHNTVVVATENDS